MRERDRKIKSKIFLKLIAVVSLGFVLFLFFLIFKSNYFRIKIVNIKIDGVSCVDEKSLTERSAFLGQNIFYTEQKKIIDQLKKDFICIKKINLSKKIPDRVILHIEERKGVATLFTIKNWEASASSFIENTASISAFPQDNGFLVDEEGVVFAKTDNMANLPRLGVVGLDIVIGFNLENDYLRKSLKLQSELTQLGVDSSYSIIFNKLLISQLRPKVIFNLEENIDMQIASLQLILQKAKIDSEDLEFIDLRFDKPIVRNVPKKK